MTFRTLIILAFIVSAIKSKEEKKLIIHKEIGDDVVIDLLPGEEKTYENIEGVKDFTLPLQGSNNFVTLKIPKVEHNMTVEYCGFNSLDPEEIIKCMEDTKKVPMTEKEEGSEYILSGKFTLKKSDYKYVDIIITTKEQLEYLTIKDDQNSAQKLSISLLLFALILSLV